METIDGVVILLKGARKERGCAIEAVMDVVALANNFQSCQAERSELGGAKRKPALVTLHCMHPGTASDARHLRCTSTVHFLIV